MAVGFISQKLLITPHILNSDFALMPAIPLFFTIYGLVAIKIMKAKPNSSVTVLLAVKMLKILLSLGVILVYIIMEGENSTAFLLSYLAYFVIYLVFETWMLSTINKKTKINNE